MFCRYNNNEGFVHESFLKRLEDEIGSSLQYAAGSAQLCDRVFPTDKLPMDSSREMTRKNTSPRNELEIQKTDEPAETLQSTEKAATLRYKSLLCKCKCINVDVKVNCLFPCKLALRPSVKICFFR